MLPKTRQRNQTACRAPFPLLRRLPGRVGQASRLPGLLAFPLRAKPCYDPAPRRAAGRHPRTLIGDRPMSFPRTRPRSCPAPPAFLPPPAPPSTLRGRTSWPVLLRRWTLVLLAVGVAWRLTRYLLRLPIWGDEAFVCLNLVDRNYLDLTRPLRFIQVAPILFLWSELTAYRVLGGSELAVRLIPVLAGLGGLLLFRRLARTSVGPLAAALAVGILAVSYYPVRHSCEVKPYADDLLAAATLLTLACGWLRRPSRPGRLAALVLLVPVALAASYPAVFIALAVSVVLAPRVWRLRCQHTWALYLAYNALAAATFIALYRLIGRAQFTSAGGADNPFWDAWFPPAQPVALLRWLLAVHTGNLLAYPFGGPGGGSLATLLLCLAGAWALWQTRRREFLALLLLPFGLTFLAAVSHRYPYGGSARVAQHLAPAICLLAGTGLAALLTRLIRSDGHRRRAVLGAFVALAAFGLIGLMRDVRKPYKTDGDRQVRTLIQNIVLAAQPRDVVTIEDRTICGRPTFEWYLRPLADRVAWDGQPDMSQVAAAQQLWCLSFEDCLVPRRRSPFTMPAGTWELLEKAHYSLQLGQTSGTMQRFQVLRWVRRRAGSAHRVHGGPSPPCGHPQRPAGPGAYALSPTFMRTNPTSPSPACLSNSPTVRESSLTNG